MIEEIQYTAVARTLRTREAIDTGAARPYILVGDRND